MDNIKDTFLAKELEKLSKTNNAIVQQKKPPRENAERNVLIVVCMDERNTTIEEWLNLEPGEENVYFSGGGRMSLETLEKVFGSSISNSNATSVIYLVAHQCFDNPHAGCAAFANDTVAQEAYFMSLREEILTKHPSVVVHVLALDTTSGKLRAIHADEREATHVENLVEQSLSGLLVFEKEDEGHAGYGIYIGDAYRAWVGDRNAYFAISAHNPDIAGNVEIALNVMRGDHSKMDMATTPVVIIADYPIHPDLEYTNSARENMDNGLEAIRHLNGMQEALDAGSVRIIRATTNVHTWKGELKKD